MLHDEPAPLLPFPMERRQRQAPRGCRRRLTKLGQRGWESQASWVNAGAL